MEFFMTLVGFIILGYVGYLAINRFPTLKNFFKSDLGSPDIFQKDFWQTVFKNKNIQKRLLFTLLIIVIYKLGTFIPIPGVDTGAIKEFQQRRVQASTGNFVAFSAYFGSRKAYSIFNFGIFPYLSACGTLLFFSIFIKPLRKLFFGEQNGRKKVVKYSIILSLIICALQSYFWALRFENPNAFMGVSIVPDPGLLFRMLAVCSLIAGFCLLLWLANLISRKGIGNGIAIIIFSDLVVSLTYSVKRSMIEFSSKNYQPFYYLLFFLFLIFTIVLAVYVTRWRRNIAFSVGGKESVFPLRLSWVGRSPIAMAQSIIFLPATIASFVPNQMFQNFENHLSRGGFVYYIVYGFIIYVSAYIYKIIVTDPNYFSQLFKRFDVSCKDVDFIADFKKITKKLTLYVSILFIVVAMLPDMLMAFFKMPYFVASVFGLGGFLVVTGVTCDIIEQLKAKLESENTQCNTTCLIAFDEIEANVKKTYLEANGISCVIEPYRFTWGMPIRTAIDEYRLNVLNEKVNDAQNLLNK